MFFPISHIKFVYVDLSNKLELWFRSVCSGEGGES